MTSNISIKITDNFKREEYDDFVNNNPRTSIFQTLEMAEVYRRNKNSEPLILVAINEDTGKILATLLAKILIEKPGFFESFSRHSTIRGGPLFIDTQEGISAVSLLLEHYNEIVKKKALYTRIYPLYDVSQIIPTFTENGYEHGDWQNFMLGIDVQQDELWSNLKKSRRYGINRAKKMGVTIEEMKDKDSLPVFYNLLQETHRKRKNPLEDISNFVAVFDILVPKNMARFHLAKYKGRYVAALLLLLYKGSAYMWYLGSTKNRQDLLAYPNDILVWHAIEQCSKEGYKIFDFGGGGTLNDLKAGWVKFKKEFGGELVNYGRYTKIHQPKTLGLAKGVFKLYRKIL